MIFNSLTHLSRADLLKPHLKTRYSPLFQSQQTTFELNVKIVFALRFEHNR